MTNLPRTELTGGLNPYVKSQNSIGTVYIDLGAKSIGRTRCGIYIGNGIVLLGDDASHILRSTDYGVTWTDLGIVAGTLMVSSLAYLGNGIVLCISSMFNIFRSTDFGVTWTDMGVVFAGFASRDTLAYLGNGIVIAGDNGGNLYRSTDFGVNWVGVVGNPISPFEIRAICHLDTSSFSGATVFADNNSNIWRSIDFGATWAITQVVAAATVLLYLGRGTALCGTNTGHIWRSVDYGVTWVDEGDITGAVDAIRALEYLGNGIVVAGTSNGNLYTSRNFGKTGSFIENTALTAFGVNNIKYLTNGVTIVSNNQATSHIFRSDVSYKLDEAESLIDPSLITGTATNIFLGQSHNMVNVDATAGGISVRLPSATIVQRGHEFVIKKIDSSINTVIAQPGGGEFIDGKASKTLTTQYQSITIRSDGSNWYTVNEFVNPSIISPPGHLKPAITRYIMPGWKIVGVTSNFTLVDGTIYYVPFFVTDVTTYTEIVIFLFQNGSAGNLADLDIFEWNNGVPGALVYSIGTIATDGTIGTLYKPKAINVILNRGFYFMGITNNNVPVRPIFRIVNPALPFVSPVTGMASSQSSSTTNFTNNVVLSALAILTDPATAPDAMTTNIPVFTLKEN